MEQKEFLMPDQMGFHDSASADDSKHYLKGVIEISKRNKITGEVKPVHRGTNIISISGMQWILMKMFGLYLDASHAVSYEQLDKDTNLVIPELNQSGTMGIGVRPDQYSTMNVPIARDHIVQGFMVGNGGSGEDQMTTKNTNYSFINLRNPIPFQQTQEALPNEIAGKYLGIYNKNNGSFSKSYFIKRFDETPHIYHSWWKDGQKWDVVDPVTPDDLGPDAVNGTGKTDRIETYVECRLSLSDTDCLTYFRSDGNTQTPAINEMGLVAFDTTVDGDRSILETLYTTHIQTILSIAFDNKRREEDPAVIDYMKTLAGEAVTVLNEIAVQKYDIENTQPNLYAFYQTLQTIQSSEEIDFDAIQESLSSTDNIEVVALYNQRGDYQYEKDEYMTCLYDEAFDAAESNEAQRIKLITYYTFKSIVIEENWETLINYRIYAN
jgi:hypothetical protein